LDLWREKFDKTAANGNSAETYEIGKWVAVGKAAIEKKPDGWEGDVDWEDVDGDGVRKKGKKKEQGIEDENIAPVQQFSRALYACGVELDYKFFSENWKIFNEVTSPSYKLLNSIREVEPQQSENHQVPPENLYQTSE
jgi:hypothetical protein